jgi:hypothetical protein
MLAAPAASSAQVAVGVSVTFAPPALPVYIQPPCPGPGFIWTPGYWAWDPDFGYYWIPGVWVPAPFPGALWTPGYWGWSNGVFVWYGGYWGPVVGFYGGINYGFGYTGYGYEGGYWDRDVFYYNRSVNNVSVTKITNVYNKTVTKTATKTRVSYNGGPGGTKLRPTAAQSAAARERQTPPTDVQKRHERVARDNPKQRATVNRGRPAIAAAPKPGELTGRGVVRASRAGAPYKAPPGSAAGPSAPARTERPAGVEKRQRALEKATPPARSERPAGAEKRQRAPEKAAPPARTERPAGVEKRQRAPEKAAPPARTERPVAPRNEPARPAYKPSEPRPAPERPGATRPPSTPRAAPKRPDTPHPPLGDDTNREKDKPLQR